MQLKTSQEFLENDIMVNIAKARGCTEAQVAIGWAISKGVAISTKTEKEHRMKENLEGTAVKLQQEDIEAINKLNINQRVFWNPYDIK